MGSSIISRDNIRWMPFLNVSGKEIPPFACMQIAGWPIPPELGYGTFEEDGMPIWKLTIPGKHAEETQNSAVLFINDCTPVPPGGRGSCTRDWPAKVLHDGRVDGMRPGYSCGPRANQWYIVRNGTAFACHGHDQCDANSSSKGNLHTVWISAEYVERTDTWGSFFSEGTVQAEAESNFIVGFGGTFDPMPDGQQTPVLNIEIDGESQAYKIKQTTRRLMVSFSGTVYAAKEVARGTVLRIAIAHFRPGKGVLGRFIGMREQDIEFDRYQAEKIEELRKENIAITGQFMRVMKDDFLVLGNATNEPVSIIYPSFQVCTVERGGFSPVPSGE